MLELRCHCEGCGKALPPDTPDVMICSFECTFCADCAQRYYNNTCPNCGGDLVLRPIRPRHLLEKYPASTVRRPLVGGAG